MTGSSTQHLRTTATAVDSLTLDVADPVAAESFYTAAFGLGSVIHVRASDAPYSGFRGFTVSLVVSQPADVNGFVDAALCAGATRLSPAPTASPGLPPFRGSSGTRPGLAEAFELVETPRPNR